MTTALPFHGALKLGSRGPAVEAAKRALYRALDDGAKWRGFIKQAAAVRRTFGPFFRRDLLNYQRQLTITADGTFNLPTLRSLELSGHFDALARGLWLKQYAHPQLIEPTQGFASLHRELWEDYSVGREMGLTDEGTYNPASRLPSGKPSDHAAYPAWAFDLGFAPENGWENGSARGFFQHLIGRPEIHYVILGDKIWSRERGVHAYTAGGHDGHVHTSGLH